MAASFEIYNRADALCTAFMAMRPDLPPKALDEWLLIHESKLTPDEYTAGWAVLALHPDGASFDQISANLEDL